MKIKSLHMENLTSVMAGLGKTEVTIDFTKGSNTKVLLIGDNGSGKSVILSSATPYRGTNDDRSVTPLEGKKGLKEIVYEKDGKEIRIQHYYGTPAQNKSYIQVNGQELNENGNIKSFNEAMEAELEVTPDYFVVGRLGDNVKNFINYTTTDRKKYINKFIPNIDEYLEAHKIITEKTLQLDKRLKALNVEMEKYLSLDDLKAAKDTREATKTTLIQSIQKTESEKENLSKSLLTYQEQITSLTEQKTAIAEKHGLTTTQSLEDQFKEKHDALEQLLNRSENIKKAYESGTIQQNIEAKKNDQQVAAAKADQLSKFVELHQKNLTDETTSYREEQLRVQSLKYIDVEDLQAQVKNLNDSITTLRTEVETTRATLASYNYPLAADMSVEELKKGLDTLDKHWNSYQVRREDKVNLDLWQEVGLEPPSNRIPELAARIDQLSDAYNKLNDDLDELNTKGALVDFLEEVKDHPHTSECPLIPIAKESIPASYTSLADLDQQGRDLAKQLDQAEKNLLEWNAYLSSLHDFRMFLASVTEGDMKTFHDALLQGLPLVDLYAQEDLTLLKYSDIKTYISLRQQEVNLTAEIEVLTSKLPSLEAHLATAGDSNQLLESLKTSLTKTESKIADLQAKLAESRQEKEQADLGRDKLTNTVRFLTMIKNQDDELQKIQAALNEGEELAKQLHDLQEQVTQTTTQVTKLGSDLIAYNLQLTNLDAELDSYNRQYYVVEGALKELALINDVRAYYLKVRDALDPKKGIPLVFINTYLVDIAQRANDLLGIAYNGSFSIRFEVNQKDFKIIVMKADGTELDDISLASQGEISMTNTSLSLAMMANITAGYNIIYLDEVDATLDNTNRRNFLSVLDKQIEVLGSEQVFIISHNNEFYSADVDLILLNGFESKINIHDEVLMANKTILYKN